MSNLNRFLSIPGLLRSDLCKIFDDLILISNNLNLESNGIFMNNEIIMESEKFSEKLLEIFEKFCSSQCFGYENKLNANSSSDLMCNFGVAWLIWKNFISSILITKTSLFSYKVFVPVYLKFMNLLFFVVLNRKIFISSTFDLEIRHMYDLLLSISKEEACSNSEKISFLHPFFKLLFNNYTNLGKFDDLLDIVINSIRVFPEFFTCDLLYSQFVLDIVLFKLKNLKYAVRFDYISKIFVKVSIEIFSSFKISVLLDESLSNSSVQLYQNFLNSLLLILPYSDGFEVVEVLNFMKVYNFEINSKFYHIKWRNIDMIAKYFSLDHEITSRKL